MTRGRLFLLVVAAATAATGTGFGGPAAVVFDGLGLDDFEGGGSIAAELRRLEAEQRQANQAALPRLVVAAPSAASAGAAQTPLVAELKSRIEGFDVAAGVVADTRLLADGPARWVGRVGMANATPEGRESVELRTILGSDAERSLVGLEIGPRIERRLRRGTMFFIDGKAEAQARRAADSGWWSIPGTATDGGSMVGVTARTGLVR